MKEISQSDKWQNMPKENYERDYKREQMYLEREREQDSKRLQKFENDVTKLKLYDF